MRITHPASLELDEAESLKDGRVVRPKRWEKKKRWPDCGCCLLTSHDTDIDYSSEPIEQFRHLIAARVRGKLFTSSSVCTLQLENRIKHTSKVETTSHVESR